MKVHPWRIARAVEEALGGAAALAFKRPFRALGLALLLTAVGLLSARRLSVDTDMANMLPDSVESVRNVERLEQQFGGVGYVTVHASGAPPAALRRFARDLAPKLEALSTVRYVEYRAPTEFFQDRALYYMELPDLKTVLERVRKRARWEKLRAGPLYVDLEDEGPPSVDFSDLERKYRGKLGARWREDQEEGGGFYLDAKGRQLVLLVKPKGLSTQLPFTRRVVSEVQGVVDSVDLRRYSPALEVQLCGRYTKRVEQQAAIQADLKTTSAVALLLMLVYLGVHFRRVAAVALVAVPLLIGLLWTFGVAAVLVDQLNLLSAFFFAILLGLGVDHGIHLLSRIQDETSAGRSPEECVRLAFGRTGRAVLIAALTTTVAFIGLSISSFRGFREFGQIAAAGTMLVVAAYVLCLPALVGLATRLGWRLPLIGDKSRSRLATTMRRFAPLWLILGLPALLLVLLQIPDASFEFDFAKINRQDLPSVKVDRRVDGILGRSQAPLVVLTQSAAESRAAGAALRERARARGSSIDFVATTSDFVPERQREKRKLILAILDQLKLVNRKKLEKRARENVRRLERHREARPFGVADLPPELRRRFQRADGKTAQFVLVFSKVSLSDGRRLRELARELRDIPLPGGRTVSAAGAGMILADVIDMVFRESPRVMVITIAFVFVAIWILLGHLRRALLCLLPATFTALVTTGLLPLVDVSFNYLNVVMMPVLFGLGVDGGVHLVVRYVRVGDLTAAVDETGRAIAGAILTTSLGFGALILASHPGLESFAKLALIGLGCNLIATLVILPALLSVTKVKGERRSEEDLSRSSA